MTAAFLIRVSLLGLTIWAAGATGIYILWMVVA